MQVSAANIIRFPVAASTAPRRVEHEPSPEVAAARADVIAFPPDAAEPQVALTAQSHGMIFAAHRIAGRVAEQLDHVLAL